MKFSQFLAASLVCGTGLASAAAEFQYYVFPLAGLTGISQSALKPDSTEPKQAKYSGMINEKYADIFFDGATNGAAQKNLGRYFEKKVAAAFPTSVVGPNQVTSGKQGKYAYQPYSAAQCSPTFKVNYRDSFGVAIGVSRLSTYFNTYSDFTRVLIPITYTIRFVKLNGASIIFSKSETINTELTSSTADFFAPGTQDISAANTAKIKGAILNDAVKVIDRLVDAAVKNFSPKQTDIGVAARDGDYFIFDRGSEVGFSSGEDFDALNEKGEEFSFTVNYATDGLAVAVASDFSKDIKRATNALRTGAKLKFSFTKNGKDDAKPTVLAVQYTSADKQPLPPVQVLDNALQSIVADDIGFKAPFNLIKQDADFVRLKTQIRGEANCESTMFTEMHGFADNTTLPRQSPDYYLKLDQFSSPVFSVAGQTGSSTKSVFNSAVELSLIDRSNFVRQVFVGSNNYELDNMAGKGLALEQATEVNLKNASLAALKSLIEGFSPKQKILKINAVSGGNATLSETLPLNAFNQVQIARPLTVGKGNKTVYLPLPRSDVQFERPSQDSATFALKGQLKTSDVVLLSSSGGNNRALKLCDVNRKRYFLPANLQHMSGADEMVGRAVAVNLKDYDLIESNSVFLQSAAIALRDGMFEAQSPVAAVETPFCILPMEMQQFTKNDCAAGKCSGKASVSSGIRIFEANNKIGESVLGAGFDFSEIKADSLSSFVGLKAYEQQISSIPQHKSKLK